MKKYYILFCTFCFLTWHFSKAQTFVSSVDLQKYSGKWYVIACVPTSFDEKWNYTTETYSINSNGTIDIETNYIKAPDPDKKKKEPKPKSVSSKGFPDKNTGNKSWEVQFVWPVKVPYLIEELPADYSYTVVGHPEKKYLYIMSREKLMNDSLYSGITARCAKRGYDLSQLIKVPQ